MSVTSLSSEGDRRLVALEAKATCAPSTETDGLKLSPSPATVVLPLRSDTSSVAPPSPRLRRKTSRCSLVSPATRSVASEEKATTVASRLRLGSSLAPSPAAEPSAATLTRAVPGLAPRLRTKTSACPLPSPATRLAASDVKATADPVRSMDGARLSPLPCVPSPATLTRVTALSCRS